MHIDVVIPTYNRSALLRRTLQSLLDARIPAGMERTVILVDNNSPDDTAAVVSEFAPRFGGALRYVFERRPGRSNALNAGIAAATGDLVGMIDDDEEVDAGWFEEVARAFADPTLDYISGPYAPRWGAEPPAWLPKHRNGVIGWIDGGPEIYTFGPETEGTLMGGNAVVRLSRLREVGPYDVSLGRSTDGRLLSCEDEDMQKRLHAVGARGEYRPGLVIYHYIPAERMTRRYHIRWWFWYGVSSGVRDRTKPEPAVYLFGVPRYRFGIIARNALALVPGLFGRGRLGNHWARFTALLNVVELAGLYYGKYRFRPAHEPTTTAVQVSEASTAA